MKRFLNLADFSREQILDLLALAQALQDKPDPRALAGKILGLVFFNPSLRTLASFQAGMARLGGSSFVITPGQGTWQLETRQGAIMKGAAAEHIREGIPVLASYCDALGVRAFAEGKNLEQDIGESLFGMIDELCDKPLINMESAMNHPCQALADWRTMDELKVPQSQVRPELGLPSEGAALGRARGRHAHGGHARHGGGGAASGWLRPAAANHDRRALSRGRRRRLAHRDLRSHRSPRRRERAVCEGVGYHHVLRRHRGGLAAARRSLRLVRARAMVRGCIARRQAHALPAGAPQCRGRR